MGLPEQPRRGRYLVLGLIAAGLVLAAFAAWFRGQDRPAGGRPFSRAIPGEGDRVVVEVLNTTQAVGLARAATRRLRDGGIDVVAIGTDTGAVLDSTQILVRRGSPDRADRVAQVLGVGRVQMLPEPARLVDVTVRLGRDFIGRQAGPAGDP